MPICSCTQVCRKGGQLEGTCRWYLAVGVCKHPGENLTQTLEVNPTKKEQRDNGKVMMNIHVCTVQVVYILVNIHAEYHSFFLNSY